MSTHTALTAMTHYLKERTWLGTQRLTGRSR